MVGLSKLKIEFVNAFGYFEKVFLALKCLFYRYYFR